MRTRYAIHLVLWTALMTPAIGGAAVPTADKETMRTPRNRFSPYLATEFEVTSPSLSAVFTTATLSAAPTTATLRQGPPDYSFLKREGTGEWKRLPGGIWIRDLHPGKGKTPEKGSAVYMSYRGYFEDGQCFASTYATGRNVTKWFAFTYGDGTVMPSLEDGIATLKEGGRRIVVIPPELGYGEYGYDAPEENAIDIPPNATLIYEVTFLWLREPETHKLNLFE